MIREYLESDYNQVNVLGREISIDYKFNLCPVSRCFVYEIDNELVGFIIVDIFDDRAEVIDIAVSLMYRNKKIGDTLLKKILFLSKEKGCDNVTLEVKTNNDSAIKLYKNNDFKIVSIRKKYYSKGTMDAYLMLRKL